MSNSKEIVDPVKDVRLWEEYYEAKHEKRDEVVIIDTQCRPDKSKGNKYLFGTDVKENSEIFNIAKFNGLNDEFHGLDFVHNNYDQLSRVSHECFDIVRKLLILFAIILELDDELYFANRHKYEDPSDDQFRYMKYHPRTPEDDSKVDNIWARAHTDFGTLTLHNEIELVIIDEGKIIN
ncbi:uncharacterized protein RJT21DRAFT_127715 [Scheffersomyces amazonensis]|uniref:uncharacterized protein n=1 Tax=Scheffersomyces amazonensis TaxID=1078765 RepID=UPI00315C8D9F